MAQAGQRLGFLLEPSGELRVLLALRREDFQSHQPVKPGLAGFIDHSHAATPETFNDFQLRKEFRYGVGRGRIGQGRNWLGAG